MHYGFSTPNPVSTLSMPVTDGESWKIELCDDGDSPNCGSRAKDDNEKWPVSEIRIQIWVLPWSTCGRRNPPQRRARSRLEAG